MTKTIVFTMVMVKPNQTRCQRRYSNNAHLKLRNSTKVARHKNDLSSNPNLFITIEKRLCHSLKKLRLTLWLEGWTGHRKNKEPAEKTAWKNVNISVDVQHKSTYEWCISAGMQWILTTTSHTEVKKNTKWHLQGGHFPVLVKFPDFSRCIWHSSSIQVYSWVFLITSSYFMHCKSSKALLW